MRFAFVFIGRETQLTGALVFFLGRNYVCIYNGCKSTLSSTLKGKGEVVIPSQGSESVKSCSTTESGVMKKLRSATLFWTGMAQECCVWLRMFLQQPR
jgi:hypothetical protein